MTSPTRAEAEARLTDAVLYEMFDRLDLDTRASAVDDAREIILTALYGPTPETPRTCEHCDHFTGCDLSDPDDDLGKCVLRIGEPFAGGWQPRGGTCDKWAKPETPTPAETDHE